MRDTPTAESFDCPWADQEGACWPTLALSTLSPTRGIQAFWIRGCTHKHAMKHFKLIVRYNTINTMKINISVTRWINKIMYT